ncbi:MAG TPA: class I SAM-dependent methyltransferase [Gemmatimonadaceae bacterium]|nr:class I SAM-dependent methyltransferase [Gemmatimonadaceae bacterium]
MIDPKIKDYYDRAPEESRLRIGAGQLEELRTRELILRHAPKPPAVVLDVGGGAGVYAFWMADQGYDVQLIDATPRLTEVARTRNEGVEQKLTSSTVGDARALSAPDNSADIILLLGPLYHLIDSADRHRALTEAFRVLREGGVLIAAAISRWASTLDGLSRELFRDAEFARIAEQDLIDGRHCNPTQRLDYFTTAYLHRPDELGVEAGDAGFQIEGLYGVEGPGWMLSDFVDRWNDPDRRHILIDVARKLESEPSVIGASAHLIVAGRKLPKR